MRYIYVDEAGRSQNEPITFVVGLVVHADSQYGATEQALAALLNTVPPHLRSNFVSHAKRVWGDEKLRDGWSQEERKRFLLGMASIPVRLGLPVAIGFVRRNFPNDPVDVLSGADYHHVVAFSLCVAQADYVVRTYAGPEEVGTVVAEDVPHLKPLLRDAAKKMRHTPVRINAKTTTFHGSRLDVAPFDGTYQMTRVKDVVHFVEKADGPFLQIADACAWGLRRFAEGKDFGAEMVAAMADADEQIITTLEATIAPPSQAGSVILMKSARPHPNLRLRYQIKV